MTHTFVAKLGLSIYSIDIGIQNIDGFALKTYSMTIAGFCIEDKSGIARFFKKTFLLANTSRKVILGVPFLALSKANI